MTHLPPSRATEAWEPADLRRLFEPTSVAVVGASDSAGRPNTMNWRFIKTWAERQGATVFPVNPGRDEVDGYRCYANLAALPTAVDVVILLISDAAAGLAEAVDHQAPFVVVFAAGFAEVGPEGAKAQEQLVGLLEGTNTRMLGPNTNMNIFEGHDDSLPGPSIALVSQSGHQGRPIFMLQENGVRVSRWAPTGNEADLEFADFVANFACDPSVGAIAAYVDGIRDGHTFRSAAELCVASETPLVVVKVGRSAVGLASAASHTGKLSGSDRVFDGLLQQTGVTRVDTLDQLGDTATLLARAGSPRAPGVAIYTISGGTAAHVADLCASAGISLPRFSPSRQADLHQWIPEYLQVANPIDCGGHPVGDERGLQILRAIVDNPEIGLLVVPIMAPFLPLSDMLVDDLVTIAEEAEIPICVIWGSPVGTEEALHQRLYRSSRIVVFRSASNCVNAILDWQRWHAFLKHRSTVSIAAGSEPGEKAPPDTGVTVRDHLHGSGALSEHESKAVLALCGLARTRDVLATTAADAATAVHNLGGRAVFKACSENLTHKSEFGLVRTNVLPDEAERVFAELSERASQESRADIDGILVCEQVEADLELVLGMSTDPTFGPVVMLGSGGVLVEVRPDVTFRVPPFDKAVAHAMIDELSCRPLLEGVRGRPPINAEPIADAIMRMHDIALEFGDRVAEIDVNPLVVLPDGGAVVAADALVIRR